MDQCLALHGLDACNIEHIVVNTRMVVVLTDPGNNGMTERSCSTNRERLVAACELAALRLGQAVLGPMISRNQFDRIADHALETLRAADFFPTDDLNALEKALEDESCRKAFGIALNGLLHGKRGMQERFEHWIGVLKSHDLASWTMATVWPFLLHPDRFLIIERPLQIMALAGPDQASKLPAKPDWAGYRDSQRLAHRLKSRFQADDMLNLYLMLNSA
jgi:hypothetical protein